jgi:hypothetical protein
MLAIKASIRDYDHPNFADRYVINPVDPAIRPLFTLEEMAAIFEANFGLIDALLTDYVDHLGEEARAHSAISMFAAASTCRASTGSGASSTISAPLRYRSARWSSSPKPIRL